MRLKSSLLGAAMVLAFSIGSASAADQFSTLDGVSAQSMNAVELAAVHGMVLRIEFQQVAVPTLIRLNGNTHLKATGKVLVDLALSALVILPADPRP